MKKKTLYITLALSVSLLVLVVSCVELDVIEVVTATAEATRPLTEEEEYYLGRSVAARILATYPLLEDERATEYVNLVGQTVALHSDKPVTYGGYHFAVLDTDEINAFACPGGIIFITRGVFNFVENEDELAAVIAHEVAHIVNRDGVKAIQSSRMTNLAVVMGTEAVASTSSAEFGQLLSIFEGSIQDVFSQVVVNGYSQATEAKADVSSLSYLERAGYDPHALETMLTRIIAEGQGSERGVMKTHPATTDRLDNVATKMPSYRPDDDSVVLRSQRFAYVAQKQ
jgi:predicted Zn-dependent protease